MTIKQIKNVMRIVHFRRYTKLPTKTEYAEARILSLQGYGDLYTIHVKFPTWEGRWEVKAAGGFVIRVDEV